MSYVAANSSVFRCALQAVMVVKLFVTGEREYQTAGAVPHKEVQQAAAITKILS